MNWRNIHIQTPFVQSKSAVNGKPTQQSRHSRYTPLRSNSSQVNQEDLQINKFKSLVGKTIQRHQTGQRSALDANLTFLQEIQNIAKGTMDDKMVRRSSKSKSKERKRSIFQIIAMRPNSKSKDRYQKNKSSASPSTNQDNYLKFANVPLHSYKNAQLVRQKDRKYIVSQSWVIKVKSCLKQIIYCVKSMSDGVRKQMNEMGQAMEQRVRKIKEQMQKQLTQMKSKMKQLDAQQMKLDDFQESILKQLLKPVALKKNQSFSNQCNEIDLNIASHNQETGKQSSMNNKEEGDKISESQKKIKKQWRTLEENMNMEDQTGNLAINSNVKVNKTIEQPEMKGKTQNSCSQKRCQNPQSAYKAQAKMLINRTDSPITEVCVKEWKMDSNQTKVVRIDECKPSSKLQIQSTIQNMNEYIKNMRRMLEKLQ